MNNVIYLIHTKTVFSIENISKLSKSEIAFILAASEVNANG